jgi:hypothetical protein
MGSPDRHVRLAARVAAMREELALINAQHQVWLHAGIAQ